MKSKAWRYFGHGVSLMTAGALGVALYSSKVDCRQLEMNLSEQRLAHGNETAILRNASSSIEDYAFQISKQMDQAVQISRDGQARVELLLDQNEKLDDLVKWNSSELLYSRKIISAQQERIGSLSNALDDSNDEMIKLSNRYKALCSVLNSKSREIEELSDDVFVWRVYHHSTMEFYAGEAIPIFEKSLVVLENYESRLRAVRKKYNIDIPDLKKRGKDGLVAALVEDGERIYGQIEVCRDLRRQIGVQIDDLVEYVPRIENIDPKIEQEKRD